MTSEIHTSEKFTKDRVVGFEGLRQILDRPSYKIVDSFVGTKGSLPIYGARDEPKI